MDIICDKTLVIFDGPNHQESIRRIKVRQPSFNFDYLKLRDLILEHTKSNSDFRYYLTYDENFINFNSLVKFSTWLLENKFYVFKSSLVKGDKNTCRIVTDLVFKTLTTGVKQVILFTGDGSFTYPVVRLVQLGIRVVVVSSSKDSILNPKLEKECSAFYDLQDLGQNLTTFKGSLC